MANLEVLFRRLDWPSWLRKIFTGNCCRFLVFWVAYWVAQVSEAYLVYYSRTASPAYFEPLRVSLIGVFAFLGADWSA